MKKIFTIIAMATMMACNAHAAIYIVGDAPFGGWNPAQGVEMTENGDGTYSYSTVINGTVYFVFADGLSSDWTVFNNYFRYGPVIGDYPVDLGWWTYTRKAGNHGAYRITGAGDTFDFTFDDAHGRFKVDGALHPGDEEYTVVGTPTTLFGSMWDIDNPNNQMTMGPNGLYYWYNEESVLLYKGTTAAFKVVRDHDWANAWPSDNYYYHTVPVDGIYDMTIKFDPVTQKVDGFTHLIESIYPANDEYVDLNGDGETTVADINVLIEAILNNGFGVNYDINVDGETNVADVSALIDILLCGNQFKDLQGEVAFDAYDDIIYIYYTGSEHVTLTVYLDGVETPLRDGAYLVLVEGGQHEIEAIVQAGSYHDRHYTFSYDWEKPDEPAIAPPVINVTYDAFTYTFEAKGEGDIKLFINGFQTDNPSVRYRLGEIDDEVEVLAKAYKDGRFVCQSDTITVTIAAMSINADMFLIVIDNNGNEHSHEMFHNYSDLYTATVDLSGGGYGDSNSMVPYYFMFDGTRYGAPGDMQVSQLGNLNQLIYNSQYNYCIPAGFEYSISVCSIYPSLYCHPVQELFTRAPE